MTCEGRGHGKGRYRRTPLHGHRIRQGHDMRRQRRIAECDLVPVTPIRERFEQMQARGEITVSDLCFYMGWVTKLSPEQCSAERRRPGYVKPATAFARRMLGQRCDGDRLVSYDTALRLAGALGMDPWEAGV